ncbi:MAG: hypothetical protein J6T08_01170, partial [Lentisphaeria bacterium]|nr:hypothetical protein [Lentisphaeria bacterium]
SASTYRPLPPHNRPLRLKARQRAQKRPFWGASPGKASSYPTSDKAATRGKRGRFVAYGFSSPMV